MPRVTVVKTKVVWRLQKLESSLFIFVFFFTWIKGIHQHFGELFSSLYIKELSHTGDVKSSTSGLRKKTWTQKQKACVIYFLTFLCSGRWEIGKEIISPLAKSKFWHQRQKKCNLIVPTEKRQTHIWLTKKRNQVFMSFELFRQQKRKQKKTCLGQPDAVGRQHAQEVVPCYQNSSLRWMEPFKRLLYPHSTSLFIQEAHM